MKNTGKDSANLEKALRSELDSARQQITALESKNQLLEQRYTLLKQSTARYLDLAEIILVSLDDQARVTMVAGKYYELLGYKSHELIGKNWLQMCVPDDSYDFLCQVYQQLMSGSIEHVEHYENEIISKSGAKKCIAWHNSLLRDNDNNIIGTLSSGIDITERKQVESALRASEKKYRQLFENMTNGFALHKIICDDNGKPVDYKYLELNPAFEKLTGVPVSALLGKTIKDVLPETEDYWIETFGKVALTGEPVAYENYSRELGKYYDTWVFSPEKNLFAVVFSDITDRKLALDALREGDMQFRALFEQSSFGVAKLDSSSGRFLEINKRYCDITGYSQAEMQKMLSRDLLLDNEVENGAENMQLLQQGKISTYQQEKCYFSKTGEQVWVNVSVLPLWAKGEDPQYYLEIVEDITERKQAAQELQRQKNEQQQIINAMLDGVITFDEHGDVLSLNSSAEIMLNYSESEVLGKSIGVALPGLTKTSKEPGESNLNLEKIATLIGCPSEVEAVRIKGEKFPVRLSLAELPASQFGLRRFIGSFHDLTVHKQQEELLRRTQKMDALGKLTGGIAHDYNNVLGIISGYTSLLRENVASGSELDGLLKEIMHACERGTRLSRKLLAFSRYKQPKAGPIDINTLISAEQDMLQKTLTPRIELQLELSPDIWTVNIDSGDFEDVILNMSINAMHAMKGGGKFTISTANVVLRREDLTDIDLPKGAYVEVSFIDNGCGITSDVMPKIFDPFFTTKGDEGAGLGLSMVYGFVKRSGGDIQVMSFPGKGSEFRIYIPRFEVQTETVDSSLPVIDEELGGKETILVVDDEPAMVNLTYRILTSKGYQVITAGSAAQALSKLQYQPVDLLLTDVIMPEMDGFQLTQEVEKLYPKVKVQLMSGYAEGKNSSINKGLEASMLHKPFSTNDLLCTVRKVLDNDAASTNKTKSRNTVLIMDDDESVLELLRFNLEKLGYDSIAVSKGEEALSCYRESFKAGKTIDIVLLDLSMNGGIGGREVAAEILKINPDARLVVCSGDSYGDEMVNHQDYGFRAALEKNFNRREMEKILNQVLVT